MRPLFFDAPDAPETGYGYLELDGEPRDGAAPLRRFVEKPDADTAAAYLATGDYRWNAGMFVVRAGVLLDHLAELRPQLAQGIEAIAADIAKARDVLYLGRGALYPLALEGALNLLAGRIREAGVVAVDTETTSLDPMTAEMVGISLSVEAGKGAYIPVAHRYAGAPDQLTCGTICSAKNSTWSRSDWSRTCR